MAVAASVVWRSDDPAARWDRLDRATVRVLGVGDDLRLSVALTADPTLTTEIGLVGVRPEADRAAMGRRWLGVECADAQLTLAFDPRWRRDGMGRLIAYAYLPDGRMLNEALIEEGFASVDSETDYALRAWFARLEGLAHKKRKGMWAE